MMPWAKCKTCGGGLTVIRVSIPSRGSGAFAACGSCETQEGVWLRTLGLLRDYGVEITTEVER